MKPAPGREQLAALGLTHVLAPLDRLTRLPFVPISELRARQRHEEAQQPVGSEYRPEVVGKRRPFVRRHLVGRLVAGLSSPDEHQAEHGEHSRRQEAGELAVEKEQEQGVRRVQRADHPPVQRHHRQVGEAVLRRQQRHRLAEVGEHLVHEEEAGRRHVRHVHQEATLVVEADAGAREEAVVVALEDAALAQLAVV